MKKEKFEPPEEPHPRINDKEPKTKTHRGFVEDREGRRHYEDVFESTRSYYDPDVQRTIETKVGTDGVDEFGDTEIRGPRSLCGFSTMVVKFDASTGEPLPDSEGAFIDVKPENFPGRKIGVREMRRLTEQVHAYVMWHPEKSVAELVQEIEAFLGSTSGWKKAPLLPD